MRFLCYAILVVALLWLVACQPDASESPPRLVPLLETLSARYRSLPDRQDTLESFWAPDSLLGDSLFQFTDAHRSLVLMRVQFVPASVAARTGLDTLLPPPALPLSEMPDRPGYEWFFSYQPNADPRLSETADGVPQRLGLRYNWRLVLTEYQAQPGYASLNRNAYIMDYPFGAAVQLDQSDSVTYIRAYPMLANRPRPDTLYTYYTYDERIQRHEHRKRIPLVIDQLDTTRQVLLRLSFRVLHHSPG